MSLTILCAGDAFITAGSLAGQCRHQLGDLGELTTLEHSSSWPDSHFRDVDGVREAAGDPADLLALCQGHDEITAIVTHLAPITAEVIRSAPGLRVIGSTRGGPVNIDIAAATKAGVAVGFLPGRNLTAAAEFAVGMMIAVTRNIGAGSRGLAAGHWDGRWFRHELTGPELGSATVGLIGFGAIGVHVTRLLTAFGATVLVHDPYADAERISRAGATPADLATLLPRSDIVSMHARLTPESTGMADTAFFSAMKPGSFFVNTARGELVRTADLTDALQNGHLAGAALDVFDPEPPPADHPLLAMDRVVATPHLAGGSTTVAEFSARAVIAAVGQFLRDGTLPHCANPDVLA